MGPLDVQFWEGAGIGLVFGIVIGTTWVKSFEIFSDAGKEWKGNYERLSMDEKQEREERRWLRRLGVLLAFASIVMILTGAFLVYSNTRLTNFIQCQADYNQQSAVARDARIGVTDREMDLLFRALGDNITAAEKISKLPPEEQQAKADKLQGQLLKEFHAAVRAHDARIRNAKTHPYPPDPQDTCGEY